MSTIVTRAEKGSPLTYDEVDSNFTNLNTDKYQAGGALGTPASGTLTNCTFPILNQDTTGNAATVTNGVYLTDTQTLSNKTLTGTKETVYTITDGAGFDINPANGGIQLITLGANRTPVATNFTSGQSVTLMINDGTAYTITWTTIGVVWVGGTAPTLALTGYTVIELWKVGSTVYGAYVGSVA